MSLITFILNPETLIVTHVCKTQTDYVHKEIIKFRTLYSQSEIKRFIMETIGPIEEFIPMPNLLAKIRAQKFPIYKYAIVDKDNVKYDGSLIDSIDLTSFIVNERIRLFGNRMYLANNINEYFNIKTYLSIMFPLQEITIFYDFDVLMLRINIPHVESIINSVGCDVSVLSADNYTILSLRPAPSSNLIALKDKIATLCIYDNVSADLAKWIEKNGIKDLKQFLTNGKYLYFPHPIPNTVQCDEDQGVISVESDNKRSFFC